MGESAPARLWPVNQSVALLSALEARKLCNEPCFGSVMPRRALMPVAVPAEICGVFAGSTSCRFTVNGIAGGQVEVVRA